MAKPKYLKLQAQLKRNVFRKDFELKISFLEATIGQQLENTFEGFSSVIYSFMSYFEDALSNAFLMNHKERVPNNLESYGTYLLKLTVQFKERRNQKFTKFCFRQFLKKAG